MELLEHQRVVRRPGPNTRSSVPSDLILCTHLRGGGGARAGDTIGYRRARGGYDARGAGAAKAPAQDDERPVELPSFVLPTKPETTKKENDKTLPDWRTGGAILNPG